MRVRRSVFGALVATSTLLAACGGSGSTTAVVTAPTLGAISSAIGVTGTTVSETITGTNFVVGATTVAVSGTGITVGTVNVTSTTSLTVSLVVDVAAALGAHSVTVTTAGGTSGALT